MKLSFAFAAGIAAAFVLAAAPGCSSTQNVVGGTSGSSSTTCDTSQCLPGNSCLTVGEETKCRKLCTGNDDGSCPYGYTCAGTQTATCTRIGGYNEPGSPAVFFGIDPSGNCGAGFKGDVWECPGNPPLGCTASNQDKRYCCPAQVCLKQNGDIKKSDKGQFGARCNASNGRENNDCDGAQGFYCYATSPTDGDAYCTRYDCESNLDCGPNHYCGNANIGPNASSAKRTIGQVQKVCLKRDYCAPCSSDLDCVPTIGGQKTHCVPDDNLQGFCTPECTDAKGCGFDAKCVDGGIGVKTCYPRAGKCVGDGTICSPCLSDGDCGEDGVCVKGQYTTEKSCAKKSKITCKVGSNGAQTQGTDMDCPKSAALPKVAIRCLGSSFDQVPLNFCHGLYAFGESADVGCWTPNRD